MSISFVEFKTNCPTGGQAIGQLDGRPASERVKFVANVMVGGSQPLYVIGDIATFLAPISAGLIAAGVAVSN
jgi:hypothetical protein